MLLWIKLKIPGLLDFVAKVFDLYTGRGPLKYWLHWKRTPKIFSEFAKFLPQFYFEQLFPASISLGR